MKKKLDKVMIFYNNNLLNECDKCSIEIENKGKEMIIKVFKHEAKSDDLSVYQGA